jgi:hypothetical protein
MRVAEKMLGKSDMYKSLEVNLAETQKQQTNIKGSSAVSGSRLDSRLHVSVKEEIHITLHIH